MLYHGNLCIAAWSGVPKSAKKRRILLCHWFGPRIGSRPSHLLAPVLAGLLSLCPGPLQFLLCLLCAREALCWWSLIHTFPDLNSIWIPDTSEDTSKGGPSGPPSGYARQNRQEKLAWRPGSILRIFPLWFFEMLPMLFLGPTSWRSHQTLPIPLRRMFFAGHPNVSGFDYTH